MNVLYNDIDKSANAWLSELIKHQHLPAGFIEQLSIRDINPQDIAQYHTCHFFSGIGGWAHALKLTGWPDEWPIWTASCPCQPFSQAGKKLGADDPRHLWPDLFRLIKANRPPVVMGEQVAGKAGYDWFDGIASDLEGEGYTTRAVDIPACAVNAPHIRNRLYWLAVANADGQRFKECFRQQPDGQKQLCAVNPDGCWDNWIPVTSSLDGKTRRAEPTISLLVDGLPGRVPLMRGYGNAIVPPLAAQVIMAFMDVIGEI